MEAKKQMKENNVLKKLEHGFYSAESSTAVALLKCFISVWVLSASPVSLLLTGYTMDVPVLKYFFTVSESMDGWGIETVFLFLGLSVIFYLVKDRQKNPGISFLSLVFAVGMVIGQSYDQTGNWDCLFLYGLQTVLAAVTMAGYYLTFKNCILFAGYVFEKKKEILYSTAKTRFGRLIFEEHNFLGPLCLIMLFGLPWIVFYFPGTLQWDAHYQLWMYVGASEKTGHFPVLATQYMGMMLSIGRTVFHSDTAGLFLYNITQFILQALAASYVCNLLARWKTPVIIKVFNLFMWSLYPYFPIYGYTMVKDSMHYIFVLLMTAAMADIISGRKEKIWWKNAILLVGAAGITIFRNDGRYLVIITMIFGILLCKRYWKFFVAALAVCLALVVFTDYIYMPLNGIKKGEVGEMLSIPLQQTARYLKEHYDELTDEETEILSEGFEIPLSSVADVYSPLISDGVKANFVDNPDSEYLKKYFKVWYEQFLKHPDTYIQAFINQTYGYFYPNMRNHGDYLVYLYIGNSDKWHDGYLDMEFGIENDYGRSILAHFIRLTEKLPLFSMLLSPGMYTYILFGCLVYLLNRKNKRNIVILMPGICTLLICIASPVNGYLRYVMPLMAVTPLYIAWCYASVHSETVNGEKYD
jgi:hypothetical protein